MQAVILTTKSIKVEAPNGNHVVVPRGAWLVFNNQAGMASYRGLEFHIKPDEYIWLEGKPSERHTLH